MEASNNDSEPAGSEHDEYAQIEVQQHRLPEGFFSTKTQMLAQIMGHVSIEQIQPTDWS